MDSKPFSMDIRTTYASKDEEIAKLKKENAEWRSLVAHVLVAWKGGIPMPTELMRFEEGRSFISDRFKN